VAGRDFPPQVLPHDCDGCFPDQLDGLLLFESIAASFCASKLWS
jgi:hypothetical protein